MTVLTELIKTAFNSLRKAAYAGVIAAGILGTTNNAYGNPTILNSGIFFPVNNANSRANIAMGLDVFDAENIRFQGISRDQLISLYEQGEIDDEDILSFAEQTAKDPAVKEMIREAREASERWKKKQTMFAYHGAFKDTVCEILSGCSPSLKDLRARYTKLKETKGMEVYQAKKEGIFVYLKAAQRIKHYVQGKPGPLLLSIADVNGKIVYQRGELLIGEQCLDDSLTAGNEPPGDESPLPETNKKPPEVSLSEAFHEPTLTESHVYQEMFDCASSYALRAQAEKTGFNAALPLSIVIGYLPFRSRRRLHHK